MFLLFKFCVKFGGAIARFVALPVSMTTLLARGDNDKGELLEVLTLLADGIKNNPKDETAMSELGRESWIPTGVFTCGFCKILPGLAKYKYLIYEKKLSMLSACTYCSPAVHVVAGKFRNETSAKTGVLQVISHASSTWYCELFTSSSAFN